MCFSVRAAARAPAAHKPHRAAQHAVHVRAHSRTTGAGACMFSTLLGAEAWNPECYAQMPLRPVIYHHHHHHRRATTPPPPNHPDADDNNNNIAQSARIERKHCRLCPSPGNRGTHRRHSNRPHTPEKPNPPQPPLPSPSSSLHCHCRRACQQHLRLRLRPTLRAST